MRSAFVIWLTLIETGTVGLTVSAETMSPMAQLGRDIFFDVSLSEPVGQGCSSCHSPETGFTSPDSARNAGPAIIAGAVAGRSGNRTPPSIAYAAFSPPLHWSRRENAFIGGQFRDGRVEDLLTQVKGPFTNPVEMNNPDIMTVCLKIAKADYAERFRRLYGQPLDCAGDGFDKIAQAIAAYEQSAEVNPFSSKYDYFLAGKADFTAQERRGLELFRGPAKCENCHLSTPSPASPLFTNFAYDNIGAPRNSANPFYSQGKSVNAEGINYIDPGLAGTIIGSAQLGKFKSPTLRNIAAGGDGFTRAYMHNGSLKSLKEVMEFYNRRDEQPDRWPPEQKENINRQEMGRLGLSAQDEDDVIAFLKTLTDGWKLKSD